MVNRKGEDWGESGPGRIACLQRRRSDGDHLGLAGEVAIVGSILSRVLPQSLGGVELGRVRGQSVHFEPLSIRLELTPHLGILVIGGVVLNENGTAAAIVGGELIKESQVGRSIEDGILLVTEASMPEFDGPRIFTLLRSPRMGTSGGRPVRLQVTRSVESCRKLASSVKFNAPFSVWAFFKVGIGLPVPCSDAS
jgi:hypothetical protein